jgi:hypothetical protein
MLLRMVRIHEYYLRDLEQRFPDIPRHEMDLGGNFVSSGPTAEETDL